MIERKTNGANAETVVKDQRLLYVLALSTANPKKRANSFSKKFLVERSHRIDAEEFYRLLDGVIIDDTHLFNDKLQEWEDYYNYHRPHGGLAGQTPDDSLLFHESSGGCHASFFSGRNS